MIKVRELYILLMFYTAGLLRGQDTGFVEIRMPRHYFNTAISLSAYRKPTQAFRDSSRRISRQLENYGIRQLNLAFHVPLATKNWTTNDYVTKNTHLLLTGTYLNFRPHFGGISPHQLVKFGIGLRYIYNTGKKGVWFADVSPFVTRDRSGSARGFFRLASTLVYSHNPSEHFNWRIGVTKSFLWGNRFYLPFVGLRFGRLDGAHISIQFPRSLSINIPAGSSWMFSVFSRPQGGLFSFANTDSLYPMPAEKVFYFGRYELNTGLRAELRAGRRFSAYASAGLCTHNRISLYSESANRKRGASYYDTYFFTARFPATLFIDLGIVLRFGRTRSAYGVKNINDAIDLSNGADGNMGSSGLPTVPGKRDRLNLESVRDLVDYSDF